MGIIKINNDIISKIPNQIPRDHKEVLKKKPKNKYIYNGKSLDSYANNLQDVFVAETLNFKRNGYFIEKNFDWNGMCIEAKKNFYECSKKIRKCHSINALIDYKQHFVDFYYYHGT